MLGTICNEGITRKFIKMTCYDVWFEYANMVKKQINKIKVFKFL